jgi:hypothetical protein
MLEFETILWVQDLAMKATKVGHPKMACYMLLKGITSNVRVSMR